MPFNLDNNPLDNIFINPLIPQGGGQMGASPDSGTFGDGYDFVTKDSFVAEKNTNKDKKIKHTPFADWQLKAIHKAYKSDLLFKSILYDIFKEYSKQYPKLTKKQIAESWKKWMLTGAIGASAIIGNQSLTLQKLYGLTKQNSIETKEEHNKIYNTPQSNNNSNNDNTSNAFLSKEYCYNKLINYIKIAENSKEVGRYNTPNGYKWFPHKSFEGGNETIAYGHKITHNELKSNKFKNGITDKEAIELLNHDINVAKKQVYKDIRNMIDSGKIQIIPHPKNNNLIIYPIQEVMLIDYAFNIGNITSFPKYTEAVLNKNYDIAQKEHNRYVKKNGKWLSLGRDKLFWETFSNDFLQFTNK